MATSRARLPRPASALRVRVEPATAANWPSLCELFGEKGACGGCWCMTMRLSSRDYAASKGEGNRRKLQALARSPLPPGLIAFVADEPVAWISLGPREHFARLSGSRVLAPVDDQPVWSVACMFVRTDHRRRGLSRRLLEAAKRFAREHGARVLEGYPQDPRGPAVPDVFAWTGLLAAYRDAGFEEVLRRSASRPIVRARLARMRGIRRKPP